AFLRARMQFRSRCRPRGFSSMSEQIAASARHDLDARLLAFDSAWQHGEVNLVDYLPPEDDPAYATTLRELIRHDLRQRWQHGHRVRLERYRRTFPALCERSTELAALAFEEYRQRILAGEIVTAEEYQRSYGVDTSGWPLPQAVTPEPAGPSVSDIARELGLV